MNQYSNFSKELVSKYLTTEEESNELYKKRYVPLGSEKLLELATARPDSIDDESVLKSFYNSNFVGSGLSFDAVIGSSGFVPLKDNAKIIKFTEHKGQYQSSEDKAQYTSVEKYGLLIDAFARRDILIEVPEGEEKNISVLFVSVNEPTIFRISVKSGANSNLNLLEWYASSGDRELLSASSHSITAEEYSKCEINIMHNEGDKTKVLGLYEARAMPGAMFKANNFYSGGIATRSHGTMEANGHSSSVEINEFIFSAAEQKMDINTEVINSSSNTTARLATRAAAMASSACYLKGFSKIVNGARDSKSFVEESGMLLDKSARIDSIPAMSIDENRVKATHSSAIGPIDDESVFYMKTHGIDSLKAKELLVNGFFSGQLGAVGNNQVREAFAALVKTKMHGLSVGGAPKLDNSGIWFSKENDMFNRHYKYRSEIDETQN